MTNTLTTTVLSHLAAHEAWRKTTLNLIASENLISPAVRRALDNDLVGRYTDYVGRDLDARRYRGNQHVAALEKQAEALAKQLFACSEVELRALSGHIAGACVILGLCEAGDTVLEVGATGGSHRMAAKFAERSPVQLKVGFLPFDEARWNVDLPGALAMIEAVRPKMVILGSSAFMFPHPVREIADALHAVVPDGILAYDASHVLGLIAGGRFQAPLAEGADVVYGSTHKTFPGPQGGIIYSNRADVMDAIAKALYPPIVTNHHSFRVPALAVALQEMLAHGPAYADQTIANTQALGAALAGRGLPPLGVDGVYSQSHTLLLPTPVPGAAERLERAGIICGAFRMPDALGGKGLRIGAQEVTRQGAGTADMARVAALIAAALAEDADLGALCAEVSDLVATFPGLAFA
jgi:glycine hydroxymethyltransferase